MQCSLTTITLTLLHLVGTGMYVGAGWMALDQTLALLAQYGPVEGSGNPALDPPPKYWVNPQTQEWELVNVNVRGNLVPQVFKGVQYFLIALCILMVINSLVFLVDSVRSKKAVNDRNYKGRRTGLSSISCTGWLAGYAMFIALMWFVLAGFGVIPILMWRITMQRCWDVFNPGWSPGTTQYICVDLVQYGMVFFKQMPSNNGYGLICGPGGNYNPQRGDLVGLCNNYYPNFVMYLVSFIGASIGMISMIFFAARHTSNFVYLKVRRFESPNGPPGPVYHPKASRRGNSMPNPNYEHNVLLVDPNHVPDDVDLGPYDRKSPVGEAMEMKARHHDEFYDKSNGDYRRHRGSKRYSSTSSYVPDEAVPAYDKSRGDTAKRYWRDDARSRDSHSDEDRKPPLDSDSSHRRHRRRHRHHSSDGESSGREAVRSTASYRPKPSKRRTRAAQSESDLYRQSRRSKSRRSTNRDEYESPPSDFYMREDMERSYKHKTRSIV